MKDFLEMLRKQKSKVKLWLNIIIKSYRAYFLVEEAQLSSQKILDFLCKQRKWKIIINFHSRDENILTFFVFIFYHRVEAS